MKILQINAVSGIRSTGRICTEIADYLNDNGNEAYLAYSVGLPFENGYKIGTLMENKLHAIGSRAFGLQGYFSRTGTTNLLNFIDEIKPDVIHLHNLHSNYINLKILLEYIAKNDIPTVLTLHDCWFYTGKCTHYTVDNCKKWESGCGNCPRLKKDNPSWLLDRTGKMFKDKKELFNKIPRLAVIGVSDWITKEARISLLSSAKIIDRIYNWVDLAVFNSVHTDDLKQQLGLENKFIILGVASGWGKSKGLDKFIELSNFLQDDMKIVLIGNVSSNIKLPNNIINIKETHDLNELVGYYSMADVLVNLSLEESFGLVSAEALSCGTPIITFESTANPELVGDGCGYVVEKIDTHCIYNNISKVYEKGKGYFKENCLKFTKENFSKDKRIADYIRIYEELSK